MSIQVSRSDLKRIVVAIDPAATSNEESDDTGIIVVARGPHQPSTCTLDKYCPGHGYVLDDCTCHLPPHGWANVAINAYDKWQADRIVAEVNNGGEMVQATIHAVRIGVPYTTVHATRGKVIRAEPISALYEQGRVHHVGSFPELEIQQTTWTQDAGWSPDRLDALVWGLTELGLVGAQGAAFLTEWKREVSGRAPRVDPKLAVLPHINQPAETNALRPGCQHRWRIETDRTYCVNCGGDQIAPTEPQTPTQPGD